MSLDLPFRVDALEARVRKLWALEFGRQTAGGRGQAPVDFIVDMFDRRDADGFGVYWSAADPQVSRALGYGIRTKRACVASSADELASGYGFTSFDAINGDLRAQLGAHSSSRIVPNDYSQPLSASDLICRVTFDGPPKAIVSSSSITPHGGAFNAYEAAMLSVGLQFSNASIGHIGAVLRAFSSPSADGFPGLIAADTYFGTVFPGSPQSVTSAVVDPPHSALPSDLVSLPVTAGGNILTAKVIGTTWTVTLNGTVLFSGDSTLIIERTSVGVCAFANASIAAAVRLGVPYFGITSFKAWRADMPEPPDQSGHGTYRQGVYSYTDIYHKPILDPVTRKVTGYKYVPD